MTKSLDDRIDVGVRKWHERWQRAAKENEHLQAENKRLRSALGFYGDGDNWPDVENEWGSNRLFCWQGRCGGDKDEDFNEPWRRARKALGGG